MSKSRVEVIGVVVIVLLLTWVFAMMILALLETL